MATKIVTKNSSTASAVPTASDLVQGELAVNVADKRLFTEDNGGSIVELGTNPAAEITANAGIALPDNQKATFGAGDDLQIYHDGGNSYIDDAGVGDLVIRGSSAIYLQKHVGENMLKATADAGVQLFYNNSEKLATTSTGIDVTGTATMDGLTVDSGVEVNRNYSFGQNNFHLKLGENSSDSYIGNANGSIYAATGAYYGASQYQLTGGATALSGIYFDALGVNIFSESGLSADSLNTRKQRLNIANNGDISFYEDTGTTPKFFWDASAESLGIGTSSPSSSLELNSSTQNAARLKIGRSTGHANYLEMTTDGGESVIQATGASSIYGSLLFKRNNGTTTSESMRIDASGNVGIGGAAGTVTHGPHLDLVGNRGTLTVGTGYFEDNGSTNFIGGARSLAFGAGGSGERMRIDASGNLLVGTTNNAVYASSSESGLVYRADFGLLGVSRQNNYSGSFNRYGTDGDIVNFRKDGTTVGSIGTTLAGLTIGDSDTGLFFNGASDNILPFNLSTNATRDNAIDLGRATARFDDIYATNGTIQTSDRNEKQDIAELSDAEQRVAVAAKGLLRKFRWRDSVAEKGDEARTHFGIIAQDLQAAFEAEGLDAGDYAMFISTTWTDEETNEEKTRMGVRYSELLAFIIAAL